MMAQSAAQVLTPLTAGMGMDMATPTGAATSGLNAFDFGNWTVSTGSSRADATNTQANPSSISGPGVGGVSVSMILVALVVAIVVRKVL